ncbi:hypothetical protein KCTCHS21_13670 [Cohnella abietis]|uniref:Glycoside hydrolase family 127 protein n=1 Tax=Cohnella abietis TaxID=2507935 RepID=A0A3T1D1P3_9BACL|nr:hypothetical protein KCTCHS21_13670 [Cohnella abietis]
MFKKLDAVPFDKVTINDTFWSGRMERIREKTLPHLWNNFHEDGYFNNFDIAAGVMEGTFEGAFFNDGLFYTGLEGACWMYKQKPTPELASMIDEAANKIITMQQPDGYLNSFITIVASEQRWTDILFGHELYTAGTFFEAAVAHYEATGTRKLLDAAIKFADLIDSIFGHDKRLAYEGHEEIELGLIKLYQATNEVRYYNLALFFVEIRGNPEAKEQMYGGWTALTKNFMEFDALPFGLYGRDKYMQAHLPVKEQDTIEGHAVRAAYLYASVTDIVHFTDDVEYAKALERIWNNMVNRRMYITGGIGDNVRQWEGFSTDYDLPNDEAYCETCASIGLVFWSQRMNNLYGDAKYADILERVLYNALLAGISLNGEKFFYTNLLDSKETHRRQENFSCACCPPNVLRFFPKLGEYIYSSKENDLYVNQFIGGTVDIDIEGTSVKLQQETNYPNDGDIKLVIQPDAAKSFNLYIRIPGWSKGADIRVNGELIADLVSDKGYVCISREWQQGDTVEVSILMTIKQIQAHPNVESNRGKLALERGPIVYCLEATDHDEDVTQISLPRGTELHAVYQPELLDGVHVIRGLGYTFSDKDKAQRQQWSAQLYSEALPPAWQGKEIDITAVPYYAWANRDAGKMVVWINESLQVAPISND